MSEPLIFDNSNNAIYSNEFGQNRCKIRFNEISSVEDFNPKQRNILKSRFLNDKTFYFSRALNIDTPFRFFDATYDDKIGLRLNNDDCFSNED